MKAKWICHVLHSNCLLQHVIEGKIYGRIEVTGRQRRGHKQLQDDLKGNRGYWKSLDRTLWRTHFGRGY